ncbi:amino acid permease [Amycolatopsis sp. FBCC-B4732]|uniref:amino acid permease n=1 Tax=Amycolatopsis sp. FBCC-B4732 TaxID=3079339 RepID=UPI00248B6DFA|nr:amino acid permease [Amycolatopsis sp. FBCC-B4732]
MPRTPAPPDTAATAKAKKTLTRSIGVGGGTLLTLSCVTPASSLFVLVPPLFADLGTGTALAIALAVLLCVGIAFCYSELGTLVPSAGGEYAMVTTVANRFAGWLTFMLSFIVILVVPPIIAIGVADYLAAVSTSAPRSRARSSCWPRP